MYFSWEVADKLSGWIFFGSGLGKSTGKIEDPLIPQLPTNIAHNTFPHILVKLSEWGTAVTPHRPYYPGYV